MNCMIVVPEQSTALLIRVVIILEFSRCRHIFCPAVEWRSGVRSVQMDRVWNCSVVDESHNRLCSARYHERWAWRHPIISDQVCETQIGVDRLGEELDLHFVVLDVLPSNWIGQDPSRFRCQYILQNVLNTCTSNLLGWLLDWGNWQRQFVDQGIFGTQPVFGLYRDDILRDILHNTGKCRFLFFWYVINPLSLLRDDES